MRTDFTSTFLSKMRADGRSPRLLCVFHFADEDVYISDQALGAADGLSNEYQALVEDWGELRDAGDPRDPMSSEIRQMSITIWNGGTTPFSNYFLGQNPENVLVDLYQWDLEMAESHKALLDRFVCQDPIAVAEVSRLLTIDLVSLPMRYDGPLGDVLALANWLNAKDEDVGRYIPLAVGSPGEIPTLVARTAPLCTLNGSILADTLSVRSFEDLDAEGFAQAGTLQVGSERMTYSARTDYVFTISQRGADGTIAAEHLTQAEIQQHVTDFTHLACKGPISSFDAVKVGGLAAPVSIYTAYPALDPARIVFSEKPYGEDFSKGSTFLEMQFDAVNQAANTALQPYWAMDPASVTSAARINETYPLLALQQVTVNPNRGEIVKAYLVVEWWAGSAALQHDRVRVSLQGVQDLGYLERPNAYDNISLDAEVDLDHGHSHSISGEHVHIFSDPVFASQENPHTHAATGVSTTQRVHAVSQVSFRCDGTSFGSTTVPGVSSYVNATIHFRTSPNYGCFFRVGGGAWVQGGSGDASFSISPGGGSVTLYFKASYINGSITMVVYEIYIDYVINSNIDNAFTGVAVTKLGSGSNALDSDKANTDVNDFATANRTVYINSSGMPTRTVPQLFDITDLVNYDWGWFTGKEVRAAYEGSVDNETVYILHCFFDIEYRRVERVFSDDVTAEVVGLIDDASGTYTGTPGAVITRPDHVRRYLLQARGGLPAANIDDSSFTAAGARYETKNYTFDGLLPGDMTVREAERKLARECRSRWFWDAGNAVIKFKESQADWTIDKVLTQAASAIRLKGMAYERKRISDLVNRVNLFYYRDWTGTASDEQGYLSVSPVQNNESIFLHGIRERKDRFMFDLVRSAGMAADLAAYYLEEGAPSQFYTIDAFLPLIDLQKEDHITLTHDFMTLQKAAMRVLDVQRVFGSGKLKRMNLLRLVCESWYKLLLIAKQDGIKVADLCHIDFLFADSIINQIGVSDLLVFGLNYTETITMTEALTVLMTWVLAQAETITCTESITADMHVAIGDDVDVTEYADFVIGHGFGLGAFGIERFGSLSEFDINPEHFVAVAETLAAAMAAVLSDAVTCTDAVLFSSGFGSPWSESDGFGNEPFGS